MTPDAFDEKRSRLRAAAADVDGAAHHFLTGRLTQDATVEFLAPRGSPPQELGGAVHGNRLFFARDEEEIEPLGVPPLSLK